MRARISGRSGSCSTSASMAAVRSTPRRSRPPCCARPPSHRCRWNPGPPRAASGHPALLGEGPGGAIPVDRRAGRCAGAVRTRRQVRRDYRRAHGRHGQGPEHRGRAGSVERAILYGDHAQRERRHGPGAVEAPSICDRWRRWVVRADRRVLRSGRRRFSWVRWPRWFGLGTFGRCVAGIRKAPRGAGERSPRADSTRRGLGWSCARHDGRRSRVIGDGWRRPGLETEGCGVCRARREPEVAGADRLRIRAGQPRSAGPGSPGQGRRAARQGGQTGRRCGRRGQGSSGASRGQPPRRPTVVAHDAL